MKLFYLFIPSILFIQSCRIAHDREIICADNFKKARTLAYSNTGNSSTLDSALLFINRCMKCDSIKKQVVDLKITILLAQQNYQGGKLFIDSLDAEDFTYPYKLQMHRGIFTELQYFYLGDTIKRTQELKRMAFDIETHLKGNKLTSNEFKEAFNDLFAIKEEYIDSTQLNKEIDSLIHLYPEYSHFFEFFYK